MKKLFILALLFGTVPMAMCAQDDMYFTPKKVAKEKKVVPQNQDASLPDYYSGSNRDVDEYNRHGRFWSHYQVLGTDSTGNDIIKMSKGVGVYPDSTYIDTTFLGKYYENVIDGDDFDYTRRMSRWDGFYNPWYDCYRWGYGPYWRYGAWCDPWDPWYYGMGWYDPWYYSWFDPWYYGWGWSGPGYPHHYWGWWDYPAWSGRPQNYAWNGPNGIRSYQSGAMPRTSFGNRPMGGSAYGRNYGNNRVGNRTHFGRNGSFTGRGNTYDNRNATRPFTSRGNVYSAPSGSNRSFGGGFSGGGRSGGSFGGGGRVSSGGHR